MVGTPVLFDTNILIDYLNGRPEADLELASYPNRAISVITWIEVLAGTIPDDEAAAREFLKTFLIIEVDWVITEAAVTLRRRLRLKLPDAMILAASQVTWRTLITRNTKDFAKGDPMIRVPYQI